MSDELRKRQRIEEGEKISIGDYQQDCLKSRLESKRLEIVTLKKENQNLLEENNKLHMHISKISSGLAKVINN